MINLLPPNKKENLLQEENWKLAVVVGFLFLFFFICFSLILFIINIFITGELEAQNILFKVQEEEYSKPQTQQLKNNLITFNATLNNLDSFYQGQFSFVSTLEEISKTIPEGIYLTNISLVLETKGEWKAGCNITGFSPTRDKLSDFKENLDNSEFFDNVSFPQGTWFKETDIDFNASFNINQQL